MATTVFNNALDELRDFVTDGFWVLLLKNSGYTPDKDHHFVSQLTPGTNEAAGVGYDRQELVSKTRTVDAALDRTIYDAADPNFGLIAIGEDVTAMVCFKLVTDDTDSILIAHYPLGTQPTTGAAFIVVLAATGLLYTEQGS